MWQRVENCAPASPCAAARLGTGGVQVERWHAIHRAELEAMANRDRYRAGLDQNVREVRLLDEGERVRAAVLIQHANEGAQPVRFGELGEGRDSDPPDVPGHFS